jgi:tetratricopeptide (TPR) repeat protein
MRIAIAALALIASPAAAQGGDYEFVSDLGYSEIDEFNYRGALEIVGKELAQCVPERGEEACIKLNLRLAEAALFSLDFAGSEPFARKALAVVERHRAPDHPDHALAVYYLGKSLHRQGLLRAAERYLRQALTLAEALPAPPADLVADRYAILARNLDAQARYDDAAALHLRAFRLISPVAEDHLDLTMRIATDLAISYARRGDLATAEDFIRLLAPERGLEENYLPGFARTNYWFAAILFEQGRLKEAQDRLAYAMAANQGDAQPNSPDSIPYMLLDAQLWLARKEIPLAELAYRRAYIASLYLSPRDRDRIKVSGMMGEMLVDRTDRLALARSLLREAGGGALERADSFDDFDIAAQSDLQSYRPVFTGQVKAAWRLANP